MIKKGFSVLLVPVIFVAVMVSVGVIYLTTEYLKESEIEITVKDKERVVYNKGSKYLVWTENEVFKNTDTLMKWKFNSSDLQGKLEKGRTYRCKVYGWRINFISEYRNLVDCEEVKMVEIKKLNETAIGVFTDSEEETDKLLKELKK